MWLSYPCISPDPGAGIVLGPLGNTAALDPARLAHLNRVLLPELVKRRPGRIELVDLDARVCPGGVFHAEVEGVADARPDGVHFSARFQRDYRVSIARLLAANPSITNMNVNHVGRSSIFQVSLNHQRFLIE